MSTSSLASLKDKYGISDEISIEFEEKEDELLLRIPLRSACRDNYKLIKEAQNLAAQRTKEGWSREDFFDDFLKVREQVLSDVREHYGKK